ncbi:cell wall metabolism sensor histidine kinase WalK [Conexibacter sp. DBS9H8]|uniref:sensor histidine kinase n=1 Tax=Conexibacter sp. DBS9H8 TaxID=2937801 RepID=UPI00200BE19F|nr:ATP-binding protein [Conexibacter sp. DBS9H8]
MSLTAGLWLALGLGLGGVCGGWLTARRLLPRIRRLEEGSERIAQLDTARKQFIATASHELRTPIFSLGGFVELLEDDDLDPATRRRFLGHVSEQLERLRKLSVDLLDLSRLEAGALELRPEEVDLGELTRSVAAEFEPALAARDARLELHLRRHMEIVCDPVRVAQILRILIDNALGHTAAGTRILVSTGRSEGRVHVAVHDDGAGIPTEQLNRIFEPFYTGDAVHGSGLGLAIASELAERMHGHLTVASEPGSTTFELVLED